MIPVTDDQAKAIAASAQFGQTAIEHAGQLARYVGNIIGTAAEDAVGLVIGDPLRAVRTVNAAKLDAWIRETHARRGLIEAKPVSPSLALPLISAAYDESREELQRLWADLIAAAEDPSRTSRVRISFIDTVKRLDPDDVLILRETYSWWNRTQTVGTVETAASHIGVSGDRLGVSLYNLKKLDLAFIPNTGAHFLTVYAKELIRVCTD